MRWNSMVLFYVAGTLFFVAGTVIAQERSAQVVFTPDGGSSGAVILLAAGPRKIAVDVNWLTGRARSRELNAQ